MEPTYKKSPERIERNIVGRIHFVMHARYDNPVAKKGESFWWWSFRYEHERHYSKERPTQEQIIESSYASREEHENA